MGSIVAGSQEQRREVGCQTDWQLPPVEEYIPVLVGGSGMGDPGYHGGHGDPPFLAARALDSQESMVDPESSTTALCPYTGDNGSEVMGLLRSEAIANSDTESDLGQVEDRVKKDILEELNLFCDDENNMDALNDFNFEDPLKEFDMNQFCEPSTKVKTVEKAIEKKEMEIENIVNSLETDSQLEAKANFDLESREEVFPERETTEKNANFICQSRESGHAEEKAANPSTKAGRSLVATNSTPSSKGSLAVPVLTGVPYRCLATDTISISRLLPLYSLPRTISKLPVGSVTRNSQPIVISSSDSEEEAFFIKGLPRGKKNRSKKVAVSGGRECAGLRKITGQNTPLPQKVALPSPPGTVRRLLPASSQPGVSWGLRRPALPLEGCASPQDIRASPLAGDLGSKEGVKRTGDRPARVQGPSAKRSRGFRDLIE